MRNGNIKALKINNAYVELDEIPHITKNDNTLYYLSLGAFIYVICRNADVMFIYAIEQEIVNGRLKIKDITSITEVNSRNILADYFQYNQGTEYRNLVHRLPSILSMFAYDLEADYMARKITEYLTGKRDVEKCVENKQSRNKLYEYEGKKYTLNQLSKKFNINYKTIIHRLNKGWSIERTIKQPVEKRGRTVKKYTIDGEEYTLEELGQKFNISPYTLRSRLWYGKSIEEALTTPVMRGDSKNEK